MPNEERGALVRYVCGRDIALRCPRPRTAGGTNRARPTNCIRPLRRWTRRGRRSAPSLPR